MFDSRWITTFVDLGRSTGDRSGRWRASCDPATSGRGRREYAAIESLKLEASTKIRRSGHAREGRRAFRGHRTRVEGQPHGHRVTGSGASSRLPNAARFMPMRCSKGPRVNRRPARESPSGCPPRAPPYSPAAESESSTDSISKSINSTGRPLSSLIKVSDLASILPERGRYPSRYALSNSREDCPGRPAPRRRPDRCRAPAQSRRIARRSGR